MTSIEDLKAQARKAFGRSSPFRIGIIAGRNGLRPASPYRPGSRADKNFLNGIACGERAVKREAEPEEAP